MRIAYSSRHVTGCIEVALDTEDAIEMILLPDTKEVRKYLYKNSLSFEEVRLIRGLANQSVDSPGCSVDNCGGTRDIVDRGKPLCWECADYESARTIRIREKHHDFDYKSLDMEDRDVSDILFE